MSVPRCPECSASIPMRGNFSTSAKSPLSKVCSSCGEDLPDYLFPCGKPQETRARSRKERILRVLRG